MSDYQYLTLSIQNHVATVTLNHPPVNALSRGVLEELDACMDALAADAQIKALVITGAGERAFAAGADLKVFAQVETTQEALATVDAYIKLGQDVLLKLDMLAIPTIAAINGICLGGGMELALACDIRYAADDAVLGQPEINLGVIPGWGGTQRLPRVVGHSHALELILTGEGIPATQALQIGLVSKVVPATQVLNEAQKLASSIAARGRIATTAALRAISEGSRLPLADGLALERQQFAVTMQTADAREGLAAFLQKRPPVFRDG